MGDQDAPDLRLAVIGGRVSRSQVDGLLPWRVIPASEEATSSARPMGIAAREGLSDRCDPVLLHGIRFGDVHCRRALRALSKRIASSIPSTASGIYIATDGLTH